MSSTLQADIVLNQGEELVAAVEFKHREGLTRDEATTARRNLARHRLVPPARYFFMVARDKAFVWANNDSAPPEAPPDAEVPMSPVVERYTGAADSWLRDSDYAVVVSEWLTALADGQAQPVAEPEASLARLGFLEAARGGTVMAEEPA